MSQKLRCASKSALLCVRLSPPPETASPGSAPLGAVNTLSHGLYPAMWSLASVGAVSSAIGAKNAPPLRLPSAPSPFPRSPREFGGAAVSPSALRFMRNLAFARLLLLAFRQVPHAPTNSLGSLGFALYLAAKSIPPRPSLQRGARTPLSETSCFIIEALVQSLSKTKSTLLS